MIKERVEDGHLAHLTAALTSVRGVNKTDVLTLATTFGVRAPPPSPSLPFLLVLYL